MCLGFLFTWVGNSQRAWPQGSKNDHQPIETALQAQQAYYQRLQTASSANAAVSDVIMQQVHQTIKNNELQQSPAYQTIKKLSRECNNNQIIPRKYW